MSDEQVNQQFPNSESSSVVPPRRISRRSAIKRATALTGGILAAGTAVGGLSSMAKHPGSPPYTIATQTLLTDKDVLKQRLMTSTAMQPLLQRYSANALTSTHAAHIISNPFNQCTFTGQQVGFSSQLHWLNV